MYYIVNELQVNNGSSAVISYTFDNETSALAKYYTILAAAVASNITMHGAYLLSTYNGGTLMRSEVIDRTPAD